MKEKELYFCLHLTEAEHDCVHYDLKMLCDSEGCELIYYRSLKEGHVPMCREVKIKGGSPGIYNIKKYIFKELQSLMVNNPWKANGYAARNLLHCSRHPVG